MTGFGQAITFLYAVDPVASRRFYAEILGLKLVLDQGACAIFAVNDSAFLGVCQSRGRRHPGDPRREGGVCFSFVTDAVEEWHARLAAAGVAVDGPPSLHAEYGITGFFFRDPAGYLLEVQRFEGEAWPQASLLGAN